MLHDFVVAGFTEKYQIQTVVSSTHQEYWIPAEDLPVFNENIVGGIEVIAEFTRRDSNQS